MTESYFGNLRTVGSSLDEGISKLQEIWKMPHLLLCKTNTEDQEAAKKLLENLKTELKCLKENIELSKSGIKNVRENYEKDVQEITKAVDNLKEEVEDIKVLFIENGYDERSIEQNISSLNDQLKILSVTNNDEFLKDSPANTIDSFLQKNNSFSDSTTTNNSYKNTLTPNTSSNCLKKKMLSNEPPIEPLYSPYYHRIIKKD